VVVVIRLCIDTSIGTSVAVTDGWVVRGEVNEFDSMRHAEVIGELIRDALALAGVTNTDIEAVVAGVGPGPFTGLRVGLAAASAFAVGAGVSLVSVVSHDAIAVELAEDVFADEVEFIVTTDARRREIAWSRYTVLDPSAREALAFTRADGPQLAKADEALFPHIPRVDADHVSAARLGLLVQAAAENDIELPPFEPLYLRSPDVTMSTGPKRVS
jgi:tRNA threonylcarbamoyl adenosine modification protein YeaZ